MGSSLRRVECPSYTSEGLSGVLSPCFQVVYFPALYSCLPWSLPDFEVEEQSWELLSPDPARCGYFILFDAVQGEGEADSGQVLNIVHHIVGSGDHGRSMVAKPFHLHWHW